MLKHCVGNPNEHAASYDGSTEVNPDLIAHVIDADFPDLLMMQNPESSPTPPYYASELQDRLDAALARQAQAEEALEEKDALFRSLSERLGKFLWVSDPQTRQLLYVSPGFEEVWTRSRERNFDSADNWMASFPDGTLMLPPGVKPLPEHVYQVAGPDGAPRWIRDRMYPLRDEQGQVVRILGIAEDVTDRKQLEEAASTTETRLNALLNVLPDVLVRVRGDGTILEFRTASDSPFKSPSDFAGRNFRDLLPPSQADRVMEFLAETRRACSVQTVTTDFLFRDEVRDFEVRAVVAGEDEVLALVRDVTERKRLEQEIVEVSSREQQRIGEDLHDGLGQHLTGITFLSKALERKLAAQNIPEASEAGEISRLVLQALGQTRNLARGLFPAELEQGLLGALEELATSSQRTAKVQVLLRVRVQLAARIQNHVMATHLFRIAQEAVNNSLKHAGAEVIEIVLEEGRDGCILSVTDNGRGISADSKSEGLGLKIMQYRARRIGGHLDITAAPGTGTQVSCTFDIAAEPK